MRLIAKLVTLLLACAPLPALAQGTADSERLGAQRAAMERLAMLDGEWRGPADVATPEGPMEITQTERVGTMLDGTIRIIEGHGYNAAGETEFNAFAVISFDPASETYTMRSWAQGRAGVFPLTVTDTGFEWSIAAGEDARVEYVATIEGGSWREVGTYIREGAPPMQIVDMQLTRLGDTGWPQAGSVPPE